MNIPGDGWISPEATPKLVKLLKKNKGFNHYIKVGKVHYFNGEPFYEDGVMYFEGKITNVKTFAIAMEKCIVESEFKK